MSNEQCGPCEDHARLHSGNVLGIGRANDSCGQCEQHAEMHASEGCGGALMMLTLTTTAILTAAIRLGRAKTRLAA